jgi:hypothetical protein
MKEIKPHNKRSVKYPTNNLFCDKDLCNIIWNCLQSRPRQHPGAFIIICQGISINFGPTRDEVTGEWRKVHNEELHILYSSPSIISQIKSRGMRWAGHVARMGEETNV